MGSLYRNTILKGSSCPRILNEVAGGIFCMEHCIHLSSSDDETITCSRRPLDDSDKEKCVRVPEDKSHCHEAACRYFHSCTKRERKKIINADRTSHHELCKVAGKWLKSRKSCEPWDGPWKYVAVELVTMVGETPDAWATNGLYSCVIEVKVSHSDFLADQKKWTRKEEAIKNGNTFGNYRYYLCPENVISEAEVPQNWGLLYWDGKSVSVVKRARKTDANACYDVAMLTSIMRRIGVKEQVFDFRETKQ